MGRIPSFSYSIINYVHYISFNKLISHATKLNIAFDCMTGRISVITTINLKMKKKKYYNIPASPWAQLHLLDLQHHLLYYPCNP